MASRNNVNTQVVPSEDDIDDLPPELGEESSASMPVSNGSSSSSSAGISLDDLKGLGFNDEQDEYERAKLDAPTGDWEKADRWKIEKRVYVGDCVLGDIDPVGRTVLTVSGKPKPRTANSIEYEPMLFVRISPDRRYKVDKPSEVDNAYKLFLQSKDVYLALKQERVRNIGQLIAMLVEDVYLVRTMNGDNGPIVVGLKAKVERRR